MLERKHQHRAVIMESWEPWEEQIGCFFFSFFFLGEGWGRRVLLVPFMAFLLFASSVPCFALLQCMNPSLKWVTERTYPSNCHRQLGAVVSSAVALGFHQELKCWDFSPCCMLLFHESSALQWSAALPTKPYIGSPILNPCTCIPQKP